MEVAGSSSLQGTPQQSSKRVRNPVYRCKYTKKAGEKVLRHVSCRQIEQVQSQEWLPLPLMLPMPVSGVPLIPVTAAAGI